MAAIAAINPARAMARLSINLATKLEERNVPQMRLRPSRDAGPLPGVRDGDGERADSESLRQPNLLCLGIWVPRFIP